jgi:6-phosphofructokinase
VGVPKTIDNDILLMDKTFGFDTAVEAAQRAINSAYIEVIHFSNLYQALINTYL